VDQGDLVSGTDAVAPSRTWLTPTRALLALLAAVLGGVALSVILGSSPAHASEAGDAWPDTPTAPVAPVSSSLAGASSLVGALDRSVTGAVSTAATAISGSIPLAQHTVGAAGDTVATHVPDAAPIVAPITASVETTLADLEQVIVPTIRPVFAITGLLPAASAQHAAVSAGRALLPAASPAGSAVGSIPGPQGGDGADGALPGSILTGASGSPAAAIGLVLGSLALALLGARRRWHDETLPSSPSFDVDTSPA